MRSLLITLASVFGVLLLSLEGAEQSAPPAPRGDRVGSRPAGAAVAMTRLRLGSAPDAPQPAVGSAGDRHLDKSPPRQVRGLDLVKLGWTYNCMECHKLLPAKWHYDRPMVEHESIRLEHGNNRFCLNCHHPANRNAFVDYDGSEIPEADVVLLCGKCHGPTYRDWQAGVHGRRNGYWNTSRGDQTRLKCTQCHDPHKPAFQAMKPLPPLRYPPRAAHAPPGESRALSGISHRPDS